MELPGAGDAGVGDHGHAGAGGGVAGVDWFLVPKTSLFVEVSSLYTVVDSDLVRYNDLVIGLSYWF